MSYSEARKILQAINQFDNTVPDLMKIIGNEAQNHFTKSFRDQGFTNSTIEPWKARKGEFTGGISRTRSRNRGRAILIKTGRLRRSLRKVGKGKYAVSIVSDVPYAKVHNNGERAGRGKGFKMLKRQFMGFSEKMARRTKEKMHVRIKRIFN
jgi:phage gpG-like protein